MLPTAANPIPIMIAQVIGFYTLILALRIILSWFRGASGGRAWELLARVTDPYLNLFRGIKILRQGAFDFTVLAGIVVLVIVQQILMDFGMSGNLRLTVAVAIVLEGVWRAVRWIFLFFVILGAIRAVGLYVAQNQTHPAWYTLDNIVRPLATWFNGLFKNRMDYAQSLIGSVVALVVVSFIGSQIVGLIAGLLRSIA